MPALVAAIATLLAAVITAIGSIIAASVQTKKNNYLKDRLKGFWLPSKIPPNSKRNSIIIVGLGGVGKTQLIRTLLRDDSVRPGHDERLDELYSDKSPQKTEGYSIHHGEFTPKGENCIYYLYVSDYCGQNLGNLIRLFITQQTVPYSPMKYGWINTLILMVDIAEPPEKQTWVIDKEPRPLDIDRLQLNIDMWSELALNAIFGLLTIEINYVCIFVNKIDLISDDRRQTESLIIEKLTPFLEKVQRRSGNAEVEIIIGSALTGEGIPRLLERLKKGSEFLDENKRKA